MTTTDKIITAAEWVACKAIGLIVSLRASRNSEADTDRMFDALYAADLVRGTVPVEPEIAARMPRGKN